MMNAGRLESVGDLKIGRTQEADRRRHRRQELRERIGQVRIQCPSCGGVFLAKPVDLCCSGIAIELQRCDHADASPSLCLAHERCDIVPGATVSLVIESEWTSPLRLRARLVYCRSKWRWGLRFQYTHAHTPLLHALCKELGCPAPEHPSPEHDRPDTRLSQGGALGA